MGEFRNLFGTLRDYFKLGVTGVRLKNVSGNLQVRNPADTADADVRANLINLSGSRLQINGSAGGLNDVLRANGSGQIAWSNNEIIFPGYRSGRYYASEYGTGAGTGTTAISSSTLLYLIPFPILARNTFDQVALNTTAGTGNIKLARYRVVTGLNFSLQLVEDYTDITPIAGSPSGVKTISVSSSIDQGMYFFGLLVSESVTVTSYSPGYRFGSMQGITSVTTTTIAGYTVGGQSYSAGFPSTLSLSSVSTVSNIPYIWLRCA